MITEAEIVGDAVHATGELYEFDKMLDAVLQFLPGFVAEALAERPDAAVTLALDAGEAAPLNEDAIARLRSYYLDAPQTRLIGRGVATVDAGRWRIRLRLTGANALLLRKGDKKPTTLMDHDPSKLDIVPELVVLLNDGTGRFATREQEQELRAMIRRHAPPGVVEHEVMPGLRFPHEAFGDGTGPVRIHLVR